MSFALGLLPVALLLLGFPIFLVLLASVATALVFFMPMPLSALHQNLFGAISGVSAAAVVTIGRAMLPALRRAKYPDKFSAGLLTAVGAIDIIIPPSIPMIVYGAAAQESVPRLYAAGVLPGLLLAALLGVYVMWFARRHHIGGGEPFSWRTFRAATVRGLGALGAPVIILGGIYGGVFSPTEAAAVACLYAIVVAKFFYRELLWADKIGRAHV